MVIMIVATDMKNIKLTLPRPALSAGRGMRNRSRVEAFSLLCPICPGNWPGNQQCGQIAADHENKG